MTKVWITRYALTEGILECEALEMTHNWVDVDPPLAICRTRYCKPDWHTSYSEAVVQAKKMRLKKIASLENQLTKFRAMTFE